MPSDYKKIREDNIRRRGEEFDDIGQLISEQLYSDRSHFIYELLQNAEDALERRFRQNPNGGSHCAVQFRLFSDRLEFRHFGTPFNEEDVRGISDVLKGTKKEDFIQIGKFGIGFKSVYAFTASPEIHSGDEHFVIKRYIRPEAKEPTHSLSIASGETVFVFPFDHKNLSAKQAFNLILNKLRDLGPRVLLFLRRIDEIKWSVAPDGEKGQYLKERKKDNICKTAHRVTVIGEKNNQEEEENWLLFERSVKTPDNSNYVHIEVGFKLEVNQEDNTEFIKKINDSPLVVYFPTKKDTRMGFLIQGPYRTTPARNDILENDAWNKKLIEETAELVVEALRQLKKMGLLSVSLLEALPIRCSDSQYYYSNGGYYGDFYLIFTKVRKALMKKELLPANDGTFIAARNAKLVRGAALMKILNQEQLSALFQSDNEIKWLSDEITQDRTPDLRSYLMQELEVEEVDPEVFARNLSKQFLATQDDEWFIRFYEFLSGQNALWQHSWSVLRKKPILRLQDGSHVNPFQYDGSPNASLAIGTDTETPLPIVKVTLSSDEKVQKFLQELGVPKLDIVEEVIRGILPKYTDDSVMIDPDENKHDLKKIERAYKTDSQEKKERLQEQLRVTSFILAECLSLEKTIYRKPDQVYFGSDNLCMYFASNDSFACVKLDHPQSALFKDLGVSKTVRINRREKNREGHVNIESRRGDHKRGLNGFDPNIHVEGLKCTIANPSLEKSTFIWNEIAIPNSDCIRGIVETSKRQSYERSKKENRLSGFGKLLTDTAWLPDPNGNMHKPSELTLDDLPESFVPDDKLADQLGMKKNVIAKLAEEVGISTEDIELLRQDPEGFRRWKAERELKEKKPEFPERVSTNSERRKKQLRDQVKDAPKKESKTREISTRTTRGEIEPDIYLRNQYTNQDDQLICQICQKEMPFKKRDDEYYFEAVEALSIDYFHKEHEVQFLALCPECAARYKEFVKRDKSALRALYHALMKDSDKPEVSLKLGELKTSLRFVETHWQDMKTILQVQPKVNVGDQSNTWSEQDQKDLTTASLQYAEVLYPEEEDLV
ncbi:MAG: hypothetical protein OXH16_13450 [Gemmatimonadetes bacterium]|nr:hypothetical protein [Gemmatimonadota bacterium]